jgi:pimeloyl-ACP methyl ester carboxylesterase
MKGKPLAITMAVLLSISLVLPSCVSDREIYRAAAGEGELPEWRLLARARENYGPYLQWKQDLIRELLIGSSVAKTRLGPVEYAVHGESGPYLVVMHGGPGGYDQTAALFSDMFGKGFRVLSWSRPGYLRTPLLAARAFTEQADVAAALMDELGIHKAAVLGYSAGGPVAIHFAAQYPERTWALILECAVTRTWVISPENLRERIFYGHLMYSDPFLWTSDVLGALAPRLIGMSTIEMESSLDRGSALALMDNIMKDPRRVEVLTKLTRSMSPGELRKRRDGERCRAAGKVGGPAAGCCRCANADHPRDQRCGCEGCGC